MSVYPITSKTISYDHQGGTKSYHLHLIQAANGNCVVINRWGKTGAIGEMKIEMFDSPVKAQRAFDKKETEKTRKGYRQNGPAREATAKDASEIVKAVGNVYFNKMGATAVQHLDPAFDTSGMREVDSPQWDEDGNKLDSSRKVDPAAVRAAQLAAEKEAAEKAYSENDLYGRF